MLYSYRLARLPRTASPLNTNERDSQNGMSGFIKRKHLGVQDVLNQAPSLRHPASEIWGILREHVCSDSLWLVDKVRVWELPLGGAGSLRGWDSGLSTKHWASGQWLCSQVAGASDKDLGGTRVELCP